MPRGGWRGSSPLGGGTITKVASVRAGIAVATVCIAVGQVAAVERAVPFKVGETLSYDVSWSAYVTAGTATATVKEKKPSLGSTAYVITAEGRPLPYVAKIYALDYRIDTLVDAVTLLPQRASVWIEEGSRRRSRTTEFDRKLAPQAHDPLSALYALRATAIKVGDRLTMPVVDNDITYTVELTPAAIERIRTALGDLDAWKLDLRATDPKGHAAGRNMAVWISTDPRRLPVKLQGGLPVGDFRLLLRDVH